MNYFDIPIQDYFPWVNFNCNIPKIDAPLQNTYIKSLHLEDNLWILFKNWQKENDEFNLFTNVFDFRVSFENKTLKIITSENTFDFEINDWIDVEKKRLEFILDSQKKALNYYSSLKKIKKLHEILEYHKINLQDLGQELYTDISTVLHFSSIGLIDPGVFNKHKNSTCAIIENKHFTSPEISREIDSMFHRLQQTNFKIYSQIDYTIIYT